MTVDHLKPVLSRLRAPPSSRSRRWVLPISVPFIYIVLFSLLRINSPQTLTSDGSHLRTEFSKTPQANSLRTVTMPTTAAPSTNGRISTTLGSSTTTTALSTVSSSNERNQHRSAQFRLSFDVEREDLCSTWSFNNTLFPVYENNVSYKRLKLSSVDNAVSSDIAIAEWVGKIGIPIYFPLSKRCSYGLPHNAADFDNPIGSGNPTSLLCADIYSNSSVRKSISDRRATLVITFPDGASEIDDLLAESVVRGINLFHFHAQFFTIWLGLRLVEVSALLMRRRFLLQPGGKVYPSSLFTADGNKKAIDVILILPDWTWFRFSNQSAKISSNGRVQPIVLESGGANIDALLADGAFEQTLAGLQAIQDGMPTGTKLMIATKTMSVHTIHTALARYDMNHRPYALFRQPDRGSMMWELRLRDFVFDMSRCRDSILQKYAKHLLRSASHERPTFSSVSPNLAASRSNSNDIARSICLLSRQGKHTSPWERKRPLSRNLTPDVFNQFVKRFRSVLVLKFELGLRRITKNDRTDEVSINKSSITGQMRAVRRNCAVLVGVHGAGLSHLIALREGTSVVEIQAFFKHQMFARMAMLMNNVSHTTVYLNSTVVDMHRSHEVNITGSQTQIDNIVNLVNGKLDYSQKQQTTLHPSSH